MTDHLKTIREALTLATDGPIVDRDGLMSEALTALDALEAAMKTPAAWGAFHPSGRAVIYQDKATVESFDLDGVPVEPLYRAAPPAQPTRTHAPCKGMNCGITSTDQEHSLECQAEHAAAIAGGSFVRQSQSKDLEISAQPDAEWDSLPQAFYDWWNSEDYDAGNPFRLDSAAYWAWAGWKAAQQAQPSDAGQCAECGKKESEGWFLYCVSCADKALGSGQQGEPVATVQQRAEGGVEAHLHHFLPIGTKLYAQPAQAEAVPQDVLRDAERYRAINTPEISDFLASVHNEALHQRERWGSDHDEGKTDADWFWLLGYLGGKAMHAATDEKRLHHIITTAAACLNWHAARVGAWASMRPGIDPAAHGFAAAPQPKEQSNDNN